MFYNPLLESFIAVADCGSFAKASEYLHISSTAVMKQMNTLEDQFGFQLLCRTQRGVTLSKNGEMVYREAKKFIARSNKLISEAEKKEPSVKYTVRIGSSQLDPASVLTELWLDIEKQHPEYHIEIVPFIEDKRGNAQLLKQIGRDFDLIAGCHSTAAEKNTVDYLDVKEVVFTIAMNRKHTLASKEIISMSDFSGMTIMVGEKSSNSRVDPVRSYLMSREDLTVRLIPSFYNMSTFNLCASSDDLLLSLPQWDHIHPSLVTKKADWSFSNLLCIYYAKEAPEYIRTFIGLAQEWLREHEDYVKEIL